MNILNIKVYIVETIKYILRSPFFIRNELNEVERLYTMTEAERLVFNNQSFLRIFRLAICKSPFYKKLYADAGITISDIKSINDIVKLPIITKQQIKDCSEQLLTCSKRRLKVSHTSGTTGEPLIIYDNWKVHKYYRAYHYMFYKKLGFEYGKDRLVSIRGFLQKDNIKLKLHIANTLFLSSYNIKKETALQYYNEIKRYKPKVISGYPNSLYSLALLFKDLNKTLEVPICFTSSETIYEYQRVLISEIFNCQIFDIYGNSEHACTLYEGIDHNGYFIAPGSGILEFNENGIITTSFLNSAWPLIRYQMNDIMLPNDDHSLTCFNQKIIVKSLYGRTSESILLKDGTRVGAAGISFIFKFADNIKITQVIQQEDGFIDINIVPDDGFCELNIMNIRKPIKERLGLDERDFKINIVNWDQIVYTKRNKFSLIISKYKK